MGYQRLVTCGTCDGVGWLKFEGLDKQGECPDCRGRGEVNEPYVHHKYGVSPQMTIGKVEVAIYSDNDRVSENYRGKTEFKYMSHEGGIGSGSLYNEKDLFLTKEEAEAEGEKRIAYCDELRDKRIAEEEPDGEHDEE